MTRQPRTPERFPIVALSVVAISIFSLLFFRQFRPAAFPEHAIQLDVTREQAAVRSADFLRDVVDQDVSGYTSTTTWRVDYDQKTYLEKELGVSAAAGLAEPVDLWGFATRYFKPLQKEELNVGVSPDGRVVSYVHLVDEAAPGASLARDEALALAEQVRRDIVRAEGEWQLVDASSSDRPARRDWTFSWKRTDLQIPATGPDGRDQGQIRLDMLIQGDQLGGFSLRLKVPEAWSRDYDQMRSANSLAQQVDWVFGFMPLALIALVVFVQRFVRGDLRWRLALALAVIGGLLAAIELFVSLPGILASYDTEVAWEAFIGQIGVAVLQQGGWYLVQILLFAAAGEALYRASFPSHLSLPAAFSWRGAMTKSGSRALGLGALLGFVMAAYQIAYYLLGGMVGFWSPADSKYEIVYNALAPWLVSATTGYDAAVAEESTFRLFAIPLLAVLFARVLGRARLSQWLAIVLSAVIWGFLHSSYPQDPFFARGLEIALAGIVFGWLMVRFGILAPLAVHYTFDALGTAYALDTAGSVSATVLAYALTAIPLAIATIAVVRARLHGGYEPEESLLNGAMTTEVVSNAAQQPAPAVAWRYPRLGVASRRAALALSAIGLIGMVAASFVAPARHQQRVGREEAGAVADAAMVEAGLDPASFERITHLDDWAPELQRAYLREQAGPEAERTVFDAIVPTRAWVVRYVRPLEQDEYLVFVRPDAAPGTPAYAMAFNLGEKTPGAQLTPDDARARAEAYLAQLPDLQGTGLVLVDHSVKEREARTDYSFTFERSDVRYADATLRIMVNVVGDQISNPQPFLKIPEEWQRSRSSTDARDIAAQIALILVGVLLAGLGVVAFLRLARGRALPVRSGLLVAGGLLVLGLASEANALPLLYLGYDSTTPATSFLTQKLAGNLWDLVQFSLFMGAGWSLLLGLWRTEVAPATPTENRIGWAKDAALLGLALSLVQLGIIRLVAASNVAPSFTAMFDVPPVGSGDVLPVIDGLVQAETWAMWAMVGMLAYLLVRRLVGRTWLTMAIGLLLALVPALAADRLAEGVAMAAIGVGVVLVVAAAARWLLRANLAAYLCSALGSGVLFSALTLLVTSNGWLIANGIALIVLALIGLVAFVLVTVRHESGPIGRVAPAGADHRTGRRIQAQPMSPLRPQPVHRP